jgi:hypothetical protein
LKLSAIFKQGAVRRASLTGNNFPKGGPKSKRGVLEAALFNAANVNW